MVFQDYLKDPNGVKSSGRLIACYMVVVGILAYPAGIWYPGSSDYTSRFTGQCFGYAAIFYGATKGYDSFNFIKDRLSNLLGKKDTSATETVATTTQASQES